ncbi:MAG: hypothetical protein GY782_08745 [Gammaproteobacteria bacterium]|nr:hypothetical protein [Gammaproteobacteria bacterium]
MLDGAEGELALNLDESDASTSYTESSESYHDEGNNDMAFSMDGLSHAVGAQPVITMEVVEESTLIS